MEVNRCNYSIWNKSNKKYEKNRYACSTRKWDEKVL